MAEPIVVNTGPLISCARIGCLDLIGCLPYEFLCPAEVWQELDEGGASGHPWAAPAWLKKKPLAQPPSPALMAGLDLGEAAVIQLALLIRGERWLYSLGLLTLPSLYAFFALRAGEQAVAVKEMIYGLPYVVAGLVFAFVSVRQSAVVVGIFWLLHGLYDLVHSQFITNTGVPVWHPIFMFCG